MAQQVCVVLSAADREQLATIAADRNRPRKPRDPAPTAAILTPDALRLRHAPIADCARYDSLRRAW
jgi:hypothetical protein